MITKIIKKISKVNDDDNQYVVDVNFREEINGRLVRGAGVSVVVDATKETTVFEIENKAIEKTKEFFNTVLKEM